MNCKSAFCVDGKGKSNTSFLFSGVNDIPSLEMRWPTYSTLFKPNEVFFGLAVTFFDQSRSNTFRVLSRYDLGFTDPSLFMICWILGMGHPSKPPVAEFNLTKSRVNLHEPSGLGTRWTWLHSVAWDSWITPSLSKASTCCLISACFSSECLRGGARLHGSCH